ncbi:hypothetical protein PIB30_092487 [Stylosanthes scabra]|uniref:Uncharacterized protein n=1 Tax=Stylosanthes scabra TaxID=79078 RepID=A0ABU6RV89_9FABA|nr:hypothetical protein [Stylosanthes scabra]
MPVIRAILIHCIMNGEDVRAKEIIADKMVRMAQGIKEKGKLGFPSTIYKLCKEVGVPLREFRQTKKITAEKPITARRMESTSHKTMKMRTNQCLKLKKDMKKNKGRNMTTNTTNQNLTTNQNSNRNHNFSNLHYMKYQPTQISMKKTCIA